jgi:hypothetical protein
MSISKYDDVIDSREIIERIEELEDRNDEGEDEGDGLDDADKAELVMLKALVEELRQVGGNSPEDGMTMVRDSHFVAYAQEYVSDVGWLQGETPSWIEIDWEATARNIQMDYTSVEFNGVTYWVR